MTDVIIRVRDLRFPARFEERAAPRTCAVFRALLPFRNRLIQTRWSGEAAWVPLGDLELGLDAENATSHPSRGDVLLYPKGASETELLLCYGSASFARLSAAFRSRSMTSPQRSQVKTRSERESLAFAVPQPEQVFEEG